MFRSYVRMSIKELYAVHTLGFCSESLEEWKEFLWLAIPGVFVVGGEWWPFEIGSFVTGSINGVQLAAYTITLNIVTAGFVVRIMAEMMHTHMHTCTHTEMHMYTCMLTQKQSCIRNGIYRCITVSQYAR